jgi:hypothetical protein
MRSKNEVLCAAAGRLAAERSEADKPAKAHKTIFALNNMYYFSSAEIITLRTPSAEIITLSAALSGDNNSICRSSAPYMP